MARILKYRIGSPYPTAPHKDPDGVLDYAFEWATVTDPWLSDNESIINSVWSITPDDGNIKISSSYINGTKTIAFISGGILDSVYTLENKISTDQDRTTVRSMYITIKDL